VHDPACDDCILWNEHGEVTESTIANLCIRRGGAWFTPAVACGLLPGIMREELLRRGRIREARITIADLFAADEIALINSVRGWMPATLATAVPRPVVTA
jgi:para-aminobenzoate synthetase/4-amino-4-deoxychorismate lyase